MRGIEWMRSSGKSTETNGVGRSPRAVLGAARVAIALVAMIVAGEASSFPAIANDWDSAYPSSLSNDNVIAGAGTVCQLCHANPNGGQPWNAYGWAVRTEINAGATRPEAFAAVEAANADADPTGASNLDEITAGTQPGWTPGATNTHFFANGSTLTNQAPPAAIVGSLDPAAPVPGLGLVGGSLLALLGAMGGGTALRRIQGEASRDSMRSETH